MNEVVYDKRRFRREPTPDLLLLGDGQLAFLIGRSIRAVRPRNYRKGRPIIGVVGSSPDNSAGQIADVFYIGDVNDAAALEYPVSQAHRVALDTEHVNADFLLGVDPDKLLFPAMYLPLTQNKKQQHLHLSMGNMIPMPRWNQNIESKEDFLMALSEFEGKGVLQTGTKAYDGRGNAFIRSEANIEVAWDKLGNRGNLYLEEMIQVKREWAVQAVRKSADEAPEPYLYQPVECQYTPDGILYLAEASADLDPKLKSELERVTRLSTYRVPGKGLVTVELFEDVEGRVLLNELCIGRPHNSQHLTEGAMIASQFEQIDLLGSGLPAAPTRFRRGIKQGSMLNLIGARPGGKTIEGADEIKIKTGVELTAYGKESRKDRKIGHMNLVGVDRNEVRDKLHKAQEMVNEFNDDLVQVHPIR